MRAPPGTTFLNPGVRPAKSGRDPALASPDLRAENSLDAPTRVSPREGRVARAGGEWVHRLEPYSVTVLRLPGQ